MTLASPNDTACESITERPAASRVAARAVLAQKLAACQSRATTAAIARIPSCWASTSALRPRTVRQCWSVHRDRRSLCCKAVHYKVLCHRHLQNGRLRNRGLRVELVPQVRLLQERMR